MYTVRHNYRTPPSFKRYNIYTVYLHENFRHYSQAIVEFANLRIMFG